ncbi:MAG TPA: class I SAM-dependent methyltransferase [Bacteroidota bacterium]|nr:class I SAM-dependent methyltransferase [Bacteroidota bacterium]
MPTALPSPWHSIPLADYEGHMNLPEVGQAEMLADILERLLTRFRPVSVAIAGCAGGNGFERIPPETQRVVGIDIDAEYIAAARVRHGTRFPRLELIVADLERGERLTDPVDFVYAALLLEYLDLNAGMRELRALCRPGAVLACVLQSPSALPSVTPTPFASLSALQSRMHLVDIDALLATASRLDLRCIERNSIRLSSGKEFVTVVWVAEEEK